MDFQDIQDEKIKYKNRQDHAADVTDQKVREGEKGKGRVKEMILIKKQWKYLNFESAECK